MSYELRAGENLGEGVRRACCEQIKGAAAASRAKTKADVSPVHETRRHLKKARAALRLMARHVRPGDLKAEAAKLRDVGRLISDVRDAEVRLQTVQDLRRRRGGLRGDRDLAETEDLLALELESFRAAFSHWPSETQKELTAVRRRIAAWSLIHLDCKQIRLVVQSTYKRGREMLATAQSDPTADNFHEFRKQVKELTFHLRILRPLHPPTFERFSEELKTLGAHLGKANDLAFLEKRLSALHGRSTTADEPKNLHGVIDRRREELQKEAAQLGAKFYRLRAREFGNCIAVHFEAWHLANEKRGNSEMRPARNNGAARPRRRRQRAAPVTR